MAGSPSRGDATMDQVAGNVKSFVGGVIGNEDMKRDGEQQQAKGDAQYKGAQSEDAANGAKDKVAGAAREHIGGLVSDDQKAKGQAQQKKSDAETEAAKH